MPLIFQIVGTLFLDFGVADDSVLKYARFQTLRRGVDEVCALLGCYAAYVGSFFFFTEIPKKDIGTIVKGQGIDSWPETTTTITTTTNIHSVTTQNSVCFVKILFLLEVNATLYIK